MLRRSRSSELELPLQFDDGTSTQEKGLCIELTNPSFALCSLWVNPYKSPSRMCACLFFPSSLSTFKQCKEDGTCNNYQHHILLVSWKSSPAFLTIQLTSVQEFPEHFVVPNIVFHWSSRVACKSEFLFGSLWIDVCVLQSVGS